MSTPTEKNRNRRRDKKIRKKKTGMRVDDSARQLAQILRDQRSGRYDAMMEHAQREVEVNLVADIKAGHDPFRGRSRPD